MIKQPRWYVEIRDCGIYEAESVVWLAAQIGFHLAYRALRDLSTIRLRGRASALDTEMDPIPLPAQP